MPTLLNQLDQLCETLLRCQRPVANLLQPGLTESELAGVLGASTISLPDQAKQLYQWRNGTRGIDSLPIDEVSLFPSYYFPSLQLALAEFNGWRGLFEANSSECPWSSNWFPIFMDVGGCFYAIDCESGSQTCGGIIEYIPDYGGELVFSDLSRMVISLIECYRHGAYHVTSHGRLTSNDKECLRLFKRLNPEILAWSRRLSELESSGR